MDMEYGPDNSGENAGDGTVENGCHSDLEHIPELFDENDIDDIVASLDDWD